MLPEGNLPNKPRNFIRDLSNAVLLMNHNLKLRVSFEVIILIFASYIFSQNTEHSNFLR